MAPGNILYLMISEAVDLFVQTWNCSGLLPVRAEMNETTETRPNKSLQKTE